MRALGLCIDIPASKKPTVRAVVLQDSLPADQVPTLSDVIPADCFEVVSTSSDLAGQLKELSAAITGRIESLRPDIVVVRRADRPPKASNQDGPRFRLMSEGAVAAAARMLVGKTTIRTGKECGRAYGTSKSDVEVDAATLVAKRQLFPAAAAALCGLVADRD
ncbi:hypothetical protein SAMN05444745_1116 [Arthrobacter sp. OV608]|nr:hypothetical protein SAMN05444745_1116 [Arthrobacter sp. OV608]